ncbi:MAG TPA: hypothetical protein EYP10_10435 [Armatimonadetes bacterium]|nr:hypothetical protein [Armatimonadota bacterium]
MRAIAHCKLRFALIGLVTALSLMGYTTASSGVKRCKCTRCYKQSRPLQEVPWLVQAPSWAQVRFSVDISDDDFLPDVRTALNAIGGIIGMFMGATREAVKERAGKDQQGEKKSQLPNVTPLITMAMGSGKLGEALQELLKDIRRIAGLYYSVPTTVVAGARSHYLNELKRRGFRCILSMPSAQNELHIYAYGRRESLFVLYIAKHEGGANIILLQTLGMPRLGEAFKLVVESMFASVKPSQRGK